MNEDIASKEDLKIGDIIEEINGKTIEEIIAELSKFIPASNKSVKIRNLVQNNYFIRGTEKSLTLKINRDGNVFKRKFNLYSFNEINYDYKKTIESDSKKWNIIDNTIGFVNIGILEKPDVEKMFTDLANTKAIIFDYRNYPKSTAHSINEHLAEKPSVFWSMTYPDLSYPGYFIWKKNIATNPKKKNLYTGKIILLVNETTQSQSEFASLLLKSNANVTIIGSQTSGADGNVSKFKIANIETCFSGIGVFYPNGSETQRIGITVDIEVKPTLKGLKENRDEILERAIEFINNEQ